MDNAFNAVWSPLGDQIAQGLRVWNALRNALGISLVVWAAVALLYAALICVTRRESREVILVASMLLPFLLVDLSMQTSATRHVVPLIPPLMILVGKMAADFFAAEHVLVRRMTICATVALAVVTAAYAVAGVAQFRRDTRYAAADWIERHVAPGARIEVTGYGPNLPAGRYEVTKRPFFRDFSEALEEIPRGTVYRTLMPLYHRYKSYAEAVGICQQRARHYEPWFETGTRMMRESGFDFSMEGLQGRSPDYFIASSFYYQRFLTQNNTESEFFDELFRRQSSYMKVAEFRQETILGLDPRVENINPTVRIFQKKPSAVSD